MDGEAQTLSRELPLLAGRYQLLELLGSGGMGTVHRALDRTTNAEVAVKLLPEHVRDEQSVARFRREAEALTRLAHPNIIRALASGEDDDRPFLVMEYVPGESLAAVLRRDGRVAPARAADYAWQAALALRHAHAQGLIHRDVKPSNLLVTPDGHVKVLDLGLARFVLDHVGADGLTREGAALGTPDYAAPEQMRDARSADPRADLYSLGCTLYHLLTGTVPFPGTSLAEKVRGHEEERAAPLEELCPDASAGLVLAVNRLMAKEPGQRFQSADDATEALAPHVAGSAALGRLRQTVSWDGGTMHPTGRPHLPRRSRWPAAVAALLLAGLAFLAGRLLAPAPPDGSDPLALLKPPPAPDLDAVGLAKPGPEAPAPPPAFPSNLLTVSKDAKDGGKYRTINDALKDVKPGQTVRVLDDAVYRETVFVDDAARFEGVTLEAPRGAVLSAPDGAAKTVRGVAVINVPRFTLRGFRMRDWPSEADVVYATRRCPGLRVEDLDIRLPRLVSGPGGGVQLMNLTYEEGDEPVVVRGCRVTGGPRGIAFGDHNGGSTRGVRVLDNQMTDAASGIQTHGTLRDVVVAGNRVEGAITGGLTLELLGKDSRDVVVANNTLLGCAPSIVGADREKPLGENIRLVNNLTLAPRGIDWGYFQWDGNASSQPRPGDGTLLLKAWKVDHNWREGKAPEGPTKKCWVPANADAGDVLKEKIDGVGRDADKPDFLRPATGSPLGTEGAGREYPTLPAYVGALPPEGVTPWDWEREARRPAGGLILTVSRDAKDGGKYRTIAAALEAAKPGSTIRVLDDAEYRETLLISRPAQHAGLTLEAPRRATIAITPGNFPRGLGVVNVPDVTIRGFRFRAPKGGQTTAVVVAYHCPGTLLEGLDVELPDGADESNGISVEGVELGDKEAPVVVRRCAIRGGTRGIQVLAINKPCTRVLLIDNEIANSRMGLIAGGRLDKILVAGNRFVGASIAAVLVTQVQEGSRDVVFANNTFLECIHPFALKDEKPRGGMRVTGNLALGTPGADFVWHIPDQKSMTDLRPGDGWEVLRVCRFDHNWREVARQPATGSGDAKALIPANADAGDVVKEKIDEVGRTPGKPDFLRPAKDSPLATGGGGSQDAALPAYVGAVPPEGVGPWDWQRAWRTLVRP